MNAMIKNAFAVNGATTRPLGLDTEEPQQWFCAHAGRQRQAEQVAALVLMLVRNCQCDLDRLLATIEQYGTPVYILKTGVVAASAIVQQLGFVPGYVAASPDWRYQLLCNGLQGFFKGSHKSLADAPGIVVLPEKMLSPGFLAYVLYHSLAHRQGLPGYEPEALKLFQQHWEKTGGELPQTISTLSEVSIRQLQAAIAREAEALSCVREIQTLLLAPRGQGQAMRYRSL